MLLYRNKYQHYFLPVETLKKSTKFTWILYEFSKIRKSFRMIFFCGIKFIFYNSEKAQPNYLQFFFLSEIRNVSQVDINI